MCLCAHVYEKFGGEKWLSGSWEMGFSALLCPTKFSDLIFVAVVFLLVSFSFSFWGYFYLIGHTLKSNNV